MNSSRAAWGSMTHPVDIVEEARQALARLEQVIPRDGAPTDPAQAYHLMGVTGQLAQSLEHSLDHLGRWWLAQERAHRLDVTEGPFADDPSAAVATAMQSLCAAVAACADLASAMEHAQMCTADLTPARPVRASRGPKALRPWQRP